MRPTLLALAVLVAVSALAADPAPKVYTVATSHLDTQWRWTIQTTIDEYLLKTLDDNFALLEQYPDYVFNFEGAFRYQLIEEYYPERYERMKQYIAEDRWRVCGSWLDAVDVNMPSPEALFRHTLYGNGYFEREFGKRSVDVFLPDCFGFGYSLPSIMAHSGLTGFSTQKLTWGSAYGTPFDLGRWRGVDGSEVIAAVNPGAYVSDLEGDVSRDSTVIAAIERTVAAGGPPIAFKYYGTGDTGGAPTEGSVQWLEKSIASDGPVEVIAAGADQVYRELTPEQIAALPVWDNELVMTSHGAGCYTSQAAMKRWNRRCEVLADAAERAATLAWWMGAREYPHEELERAWTRFLWHGFHDDLTGTSIPEAYAFSWNDMLLSQQEFAQVLESSLAGVVAQMNTDVEGRPVVLFNPLGFERDEAITVEVSGRIDRDWPRVFGPDGAEAPSQAWLHRDVDQPTRFDRVTFLATVPANGIAIYEIRQGSNPESTSSADTWNPETGILDTPRYRLQFGTDGLQSLVDKQTDRELLAASPRLQLLHDEPLNWAAWEVDFDDIMAEPYAEIPLGGIPDRVVAGPTFTRLFFSREAAGSVFEQTLTVSGDRLDWHLDIDWATKATLLKAAFFTTARDTAVTYDLGLGAIERGVNRPQLYEVPAQRWADLTDASGDFGLTIMNDGRHGWDHPDESTLRLTLIHTPAVNDRWSWIDDQKSQDLGRHRVTIGMIGHGGQWRADAVRQADRLNQPVLAFKAGRPHDGPWGRSLSLLHVGDTNGPDRPSVAVRAIKKSEDGDWMVVRLHEVTGQPASGVVVAPLAPAREFRELRADEVQITTSDEVELRGGALVCDLAPYQPRTFALKLAAPPEDRRGTPVRTAAVDLPWNLDGISTHADPTDGDFDGTGASLPGELIPTRFDRDGVSFGTGPCDPGAANLVRCEGQTLALPESDLFYLRLIMCSVDGPREAMFKLSNNLEWKRWVPDGLAYFGQWESRLLGDDVVHEAGDLVPAYTMDAEIGWVVTHRHGADGAKLPYVFTHFYEVDIPVGYGYQPGFPRVDSVELPDDPNLIILAASMVDADQRLTSISELVDRPGYPSITIQAARRSFVDSVSVMLVSPNPGARIRYALDRTEGDLHDGSLSPYDGEPIVITDSTVLEAAVYGGGTGGATLRTATFTRLDPWPAVNIKKADPGLATRSYFGAWNALPDWSVLTPVQESTNPTITIPADLPEEDIGVVHLGYINAPTRGVYRFWLSSDDGSRLWIADHLVADHDGLHGSSALWGDAPLDAGFHPITVEFFQHLGGRDLKLEWSGPGFTREEVPASALVH